jgi:hypothetical protein
MRDRSVAYHLAPRARPRANGGYQVTDYLGATTLGADVIAATACLQLAWLWWGRRYWR